MRNALAVLMVVGLLAAPSLGVINVKLTTDHPLIVPGETATVFIWGQGTDAGLAGLGGSITATSMPANVTALSSNPGSFAWKPEFTSPAPFASKYGSAAANGGWSGFGSQQANYLTPDPNYGKADYVQVASYTLTFLPAAVSEVTLHFIPATFGGFKAVETNKSITMGTVTDVVFRTPEPATIALLALGGLLAARRRSR